MTEEQVAEKVARRLAGKKLWRFTASEVVHYEFECEATDEEDAYEQYNNADLDEHIVDRREFETHGVFEEEDEDE